MRRQVSLSSRLHAISDFLLGIRPGFGYAARAVKVARDADLRGAINWALPVLGILFGLLLLAFHLVSIDTDNMVFRVFVFDYMLFLFGGLSGWNMARRWRANPDQVEEISLTPLPPAAISCSMMAGPVAIWLRLFVLFAVIELATPFVHWRSYSDAINDFPGVPFAAGWGLFTLVAHVSSVVVLAWFHFESVRLAHWMFAIHALPRISLVGAGIRNFLAMTMIVLTLSAMGSMITGMVMLLVALVGMLLLALTQQGAVFDKGMELMWASYTTWALASVPGALMVLWLKRLLCRAYEKSFVQAWLQYQWWGAGESRQPSTYPPHFRHAFPLWTAYYGMEEEENSGEPAYRRINTKRYREALERLRTQPLATVLPAPPPARQPLTAGSSSGSPSPGPDPRNAPSHDQASADGSARSSGSP